MPARAATNGTPTHLDEVRAAEGLIEEVERDRDALRRQGRASIGLDGTGPPEVEARTRPSGYLVASAAALATVDGFPLAAIALLGLPLAAGVGLDADLVSAMMGTFAVGTGTGALLAPAIARSLGTGGDEHARMAFGGTVLVALGLALVGFLSPLAGMSIAGLGVGLGTVGRSVVVSRSTSPWERVMALATERSGGHAGVVLASLMVAGVSFGTDAPISAIILGLGVLVLLALASAADLITTRIADTDLGRLRRVVEAAAPGDDEPTAEPFRRAWAVSTVRGLVPGYVAIGAAIVALHVHLVRFLTLESGLGLWGRGAVYAAVSLAAVSAIRLSAPRDRERLHDDPGRLATAAASALAVSSLALTAAALWPWYSQVLLLVTGFALVAVARTQLDALVLATVRPRLRGHAVAITVALTTIVGAGLAVPLSAAVARREGVVGVLVATSVVLMAAAAAVRRVAPTASADVDAAVDHELEATQVAVLVGSGAHLPLLACRHVDFSYGAVQVLFDVSFSVDDGEMVGLLGTNGAGKSTLLRVISGLGTPTSGTVRHRGEDITYLDPASRVGRGITQIPGGKAVFGPLSVVDNLRAYGHSLGRNRRAVDRGIEQAFEAFPKLAERRNLPSRVLSGGERQMLALSKALILEPRLLLIDELSLGLAPVIVGQLLDMVRKINERGTAVVLVEQSVNVALTLVDHAYYMEKGEIRFDGAARELLDRPDLLRSVYLQGAAEGLA